ncbi:MAG TPA: P-loop NTPase [Myxococcota bacterium]|nr:P-loop NTPase [Myxococcota bacterium]
MKPTFDTTLERTEEILQAHEATIRKLGEVIVNRDLMGRVRLIVNEEARTRTLESELTGLATALSAALGAHGYPPESTLLFEENLEAFSTGPSFALEGYPSIKVVDRLASEADWGHVSDLAQGAPRVVFYSIKGGVGRSTAVAVTAAMLAERGYKVMVLDLDLASPGLSSTLLPEGRRPDFGVIDWLVEDLVDQGEQVLKSMVGRTGMTFDGDVLIVPAHGRSPGDYIAKLGRAWMPKLGHKGRESWSKRLNRLVADLEAAWRPQVILIDSRSGVDDIASTCVTELGAELVLLFANDSPQTWTGYDVVFDYWRRARVIESIRHRLQCVGMAVPTEDVAAYAISLRERAWSHFMDGVYDEVPPGESVGLRFTFDLDDDTAPHTPWDIRWDKAFISVSSWVRAFGQIDGHAMQNAFGEIANGLEELIAARSQSEDTP